MQEVRKQRPLHADNVPPADLVAARHGAQSFSAQDSVPGLCDEASLDRDGPLACNENVIFVVMRKNYTALRCSSVCLLLKVYRRCCTSGLVANRKVKSTLRGSLLKGEMAMPGW